MHKAELERQEYLTPRRIMLEKLQQFIKRPEPPKEEVKYFDNAGPLAPYLR